MYTMFAVTALLVGAVLGQPNRFGTLLARPNRLGSGFRQPYNPCNKTAVDAGVRVTPHEEYCDLYYTCSGEYEALPSACPGGTLFDYTKLACDYPQLATCYRNPSENNKTPSGRCTRGQYRTKCCNQYIQCSNDKKKQKQLVSCDPGQTFSGTGCSSSSFGNQCKDHSQCLPTERQPQAVEAVCRKKAVSDKCKYDEILGDNKTVISRSCGEGTAFNATACTCSLDATCRKQPYLINRILDPLCRPSFVLEQRSVPTSYTEKGDQGRQENPHSITARGYVFDGVSASFRQGPNGEKPGLQIPYFAWNMIAGPFGIKVSFRVDTKNNNGRQEIVLVGNGADDVQNCNATLEVRATSKSTGWDINVLAVGKQTARLSGSVQTYNSQEKVTVVLIYDGKRSISADAMTGSSSGKVDLGSADVGDEIKVTTCDLKVAYGLVGTLEEFVIYEACNDVDRLQNL